jgi:hypothetical protein
MENCRSWVDYATNASRRFTTIEGWRHISGSVYYAAGVGLHIFRVDPQFDPERCYDEDAF